MTQNKNFYITTPIYYVNDSPHIGHAYTTIACDAMARFKRLDGFNVKFLTGTDEHGQKVDKAAKIAGISPQEFTDNVSTRFRNLVNSGDNLLNISNDDFIRTTEERHKIAAKALMQKLIDNDHIYLGKYSGWYSVRDEAYFQENELKDGKAPTGADVEWFEEESYFFDLSKWQEKLLEFYENNPDFVTPDTRYNEVKSFVRGGKEFTPDAIHDLSVSRTNFSWGIEVPNNPKHVMYVWLDALVNYLTAVGYPDTNNEQYQKFWQSGSTNSPMHIVGKDILRFHAVYWPAFLMAADLPLPKKIVAHGWWTIEGEKMSKSLGNVVAPAELIEQFGLDQVRFFLMNEVVFGNDGNFSKQNMINNINSSLANNIGNLAQRSLSMIQKNCGGKVPDCKFINDKDKKLLESGYKLIETLRNNFDDNAFSEATNNIINFANRCNQYIDESAPWVLKKTDETRMHAVLYTLAEALRLIAIYLQPFMPQSSAKMLDQLEVAKDMRNFDFVNANFALKSGVNLPAPEVIFPRYIA